MWDVRTWSWAMTMRTEEDLYVRARRRTARWIPQTLLWGSKRKEFPKTMTDQGWLRQGCWPKRERCGELVNHTSSSVVVALEAGQGRCVASGCNTQSWTLAMRQWGKVNTNTKERRVRETRYCTTEERCWEKSRKAGVASAIGPLSLRSCVCATLCPRHRKLLNFLCTWHADLWMQRRQLDVNERVHSLKYVPSQKVPGQLWTLKRNNFEY